MTIARIKLEQSAGRLWRRLFFTISMAGLFCVFFYTLSGLDSWLLYQPPSDLLIRTAERVLAALAFAVVSAAVLVGFAGAISKRENFKRRSGLVHRSVVLASLVLCSLVVWRAIFVWTDRVGLLTFGFTPKYTLWFVLVVIALAIAWRRRTDSAERLDSLLGGALTRRTVIATGLGAAAITGFDAALGTRSFGKAVVPIGASKSRNFLLVTFDALSADDMSLYGYRLPTTPNIDRFATGSTLFTNFYSASTWTPPCIASMHTGRYPVRTGVFHGRGYLHGDAANKTLVGQLRSAGFQTAASVSNIIAFPPRMGLDFGYTPKPPVKGMFATPPFLLDDTLWVQGRVGDVFDRAFPNSESRFAPANSFAQAERVLEGLSAPFFLWVHILAPHFPYKPSPPFRNRFLRTGETLDPDDIGKLLDRPFQQYSPERQDFADKWRLRYDEWIAQCDDAFGTFFSNIEKAGRLADTTLIVSADHGESFEGGVWGHGSPHQLRQIVHIPLVVRLPNQTDGRRVTITADQTAIAPTVLELAGFPIPEWVDGKSIAPSLLEPNAAADNGVAFTQFFDPGNSAFKPIRWGTVGAISGDRQYVIDIATKKGSLYRLAEANLQNNDISADEPDRAKSMQELIASRFPELMRSAT